MPLVYRTSFIYNVFLNIDLADLLLYSLSSKKVQEVKMSISKSTKNRIKGGLAVTVLVGYVVLAIGTIVLSEMSHDKHERGRALQEVLPVLLVEQTTKRCLVVYEPERNGFHACWPNEEMTPSHRTLEVPAGTTALDIFENPNLYLQKNSD